MGRPKSAARATATVTESVQRSGSPEETFAIARALAKRYPQGAFFYLEGELGAGKTLFTKGIASAYGIDSDRVVSPTFALVNQYTGDGRTLYHVDLYRIEKPEELNELGLEEIEERREAIVVVEWSEKLGRYRRSDAIRVQLDIVDEQARRIRITEP